MSKAGSIGQGWETYMYMYHLGLSFLVINIGQRMDHINSIK